MKYLRTLALLCACNLLVDASYPQFQCDNKGDELLMAPPHSTAILNKQKTGDYTQKCDINQCNWKWGKILKDTDDVSTADCEECSAIPEINLDINNAFINKNQDYWNNRYNRLWICPRHCHAMPQMHVQVTVETNKKTWIKRLANEGESFQSQYSPYLYRGSTVLDRFSVADAILQTPTFDEFTVILPGATCESAGRNCHTFIKREGWQDDVADTNVYSLRPYQECLSHRYNSNWNERILSCRQWKPPGDYPTMVHFNDNFWSQEPKNIHTLDQFNGLKSNTQSILQCGGLTRTGVSFQTAPCWRDTVDDNLQQFSIKPFYTAYRNHNPKGDKKTCIMTVHGNLDLDGSRFQRNYFDSHKEAATYWEPPPYTPYHEYGIHAGDEYRNLVKAVRPDFYTANRGEVKKFSYDLRCVRNDVALSWTAGDALYYYSGCTSIQCIDFMTKPCYDNVYRYDDMVCTLIQAVFGTTITFQKFMEKTVPETKYQDPFMSYGRYPSTGPSYFQISFDNTKVDVTKDGSTPVQPNQATAFTRESSILVALKPLFSCNGCRTMSLHGRASDEQVLLNHIIQCRPCLLYERIKLVTTYNDCSLCDPHQVRNPNPKKTEECLKCKDISPYMLKPMRRHNIETNIAVDTVCTTCQHFQYFDEKTEQGCIFLSTVTDGIEVVGNKAKLVGIDQYIKDELRKDIPGQFSRDKILATTPWNRELVPKKCSPGYVTPVTLVNRLKFTAWCGHQEMVRHQQAWVQVNQSSLYVPLNNDTRTRINTSVVQLCGSNALSRVQGSVTVDLTCGNNNFSIIRSGFQDPCTLCTGAKFTDKCWPTYVPGLEVYDDDYFLPQNKDLTPQPGTCATCKPVCDKYLEPDHYIDPVEYSCWWNGTGRTPGVLGSNYTNFSWYKQTPCTKCSSVKLAADVALLVLECGNRISYRRWLSDTVTGSDLDATRSIPSIQVCCVDPGGLCTSVPAEFETFAQQQCAQTVEDTPPAFLPYCPPLWYVDPTCAKESPLWNPDCCVKCKSCRGGKFKTDAYYDCPGNEYFDSQDRGCTTSCLTNQYLRNERCIKCEACE